MRSKQQQQLEDLEYGAEEHGYQFSSSAEEREQLKKELSDDAEGLQYSNDLVVDMILKKVIRQTEQEKTYSEFLRNVKVKSICDGRIAHTTEVRDGQFTSAVSEVFIRLLQIVSDIGSLRFVLKCFSADTAALPEFCLKYAYELTKWIDKPDEIETDRPGYLHAEAMARIIDRVIYPNFSDYLVYFGRETAEAATAYLVGHEIGHHYLGHTNAAPHEFRDFQCLRELDCESEAWMREYCADAFGADFALKYINASISEGRREYCNFLDDAVFQEMDYRLLGLAVLYIASEEYEKTTGVSDTHPPICKREELMWKVLKESGVDETVVNTVQEEAESLRSLIECCRSLEEASADL